MTRTLNAPFRSALFRTYGAAIAALGLCLLPLGAQEKPAATEPAATNAPAEEGTTKQELLSNSPFMSKAFKERLAKSDTSRARDLIFIGFAGDSGNWLICVYNNQSKRAEWVEVGAEVNGIIIAEFDRKGRRIQVVKDGTSTYLPLEKAK